MKYFLLSCLLISTTIVTILAETDLEKQNQNQDYLNPVNDNQSDNPNKEQDKRTVFNVQNYGWAKHVGVHPSGFKYIIGYGPVDLKYVPVIRPVALKHFHHHEGYRYGRPHHHHHLAVRPLVPLRQEGWRPIIPAIKPVVPIAKPIHHHPVPIVPVQPEPIHVHPVKPVVAPVHEVQVVRPVHVHPVKPVVPVQPVPVHVKPVVPVGPPLKPLVPAFVPSQPLFEVTRPNLGVLPFGATFPAPVLQQVPSAPAVPVLPPPVPVFSPAPAVQVLPSAPSVPVVPPAPAIPIPAVKPIHAHAYYPPGTAVEYHGTHNFFPINGHVPSVLGLVPHIHPHLHQVALDNPSHPPFPHLHQEPAAVVPQEQYHPTFPHLHAVPETAQHPAYPHLHQVPQNIPNVALQPQEFHPQVHVPEQQPDFINQQLPEDNNPHFVQQQQDVPNIQHFEGQNAIQPGHTDLDFPRYLPPHPHVQQEGQFQTEFHPPIHQNVFRPSISLEPPYNNGQYAQK